jgi:XTP/dITP diphosphohydrolase
MFDPDTSGAKLVLATHNVGKLQELRALLSQMLPDMSAEKFKTAVVSAADFGLDAPVESGASFAENALIKARAIAVATGLPAVADDSGLAVELMGGAPGILSARWAGQHGNDDANLNLLLGQLAENSDPQQRRAAFVCAVALVTPTGVEVVEHGQMPGVLTLVPRGSNGFGYDPIFEADAANPAEANGVAKSARRTNAELSSAEKNAISHRAQAFQALLPALTEHLR